MLPLAIGVRIAAGGVCHHLRSMSLVDRSHGVRRAGPARSGSWPSYGGRLSSFRRRWSPSASPSWVFSGSFDTSSGSESVVERREAALKPFGSIAVSIGGRAVP